MKLTNQRINESTNKREAIRPELEELGNKLNAFRNSQLNR